MMWHTKFTKERKLDTAINFAEQGTSTLTTPSILDYKTHLQNHAVPKSPILKTHLHYGAAMRTTKLVRSMYGTGSELA